MKTGKPGPIRLSEKLNAELDTIREEAVASMRSQLTRFRQDLQSIATDARDTIESDTRSFLLWREQMLSNRRSETIWQLRSAPWLAMGLSALAFTILVSLSWLRDGQISQRLEEHQNTLFGQMIEIDGESYLLLSPDKVELRQCTVMGQTIPCARERRP